MKTVIELAREAEDKVIANPDLDWKREFAELVRADERGRMCKQCKERLNEKSTSNEANRSAVLGEGRQAS